MKSFTGQSLRWELRDGILELTLDRAPANEIGTAMLADLEKFVAAFDALAPETSVCIVSSARPSVFSAGRMTACSKTPQSTPAPWLFPRPNVPLVSAPSSNASTP